MSDSAVVSSDAILYREEEGVAWVTLNRPERLNAFAGTMRDDLRMAVERAAGSADARVVVITGAGRAFCAGADVEVMQDLLARGDGATFEGFVVAGSRAVQAIRACRKPVIAAVNGVAAGAGASLAAACDVRLASERASIGFTFNRIGLHPDWAASWTLPRLVGAGRAAELVLTARMVDPDEAVRIGLFQRVYPADAFEREVDAFARELAAKPPLALAAAKHSLAVSPASDLAQMLEIEREAQMRLFRSADVREGIAAFNEKRKAEFRGE
ncbi:MAG TPA: enoyl-CoA hydratase-related protein [Longimicrobium sp.]|jgi:2-(1,2-epoxy-1,2-dihydrophenyl)acetyl-CoA isomerase|nr:enoyl-CoA hydratase-related protein [Longimicrobium sp.]